MTTAPPITHAIHRNVTKRPCGLGFIYTAHCDCGTTWPETRDREAREEGIRRHLNGVRRMEAAEAERDRINAERRAMKRRVKEAKANA